MSQIRFIVLVQICSLGKQPRYYGAFGNFQCEHFRWTALAENITSDAIG